MIHQRDLRKGTHFNLHLQAAWNYYGEDNFTFNIIETCVTYILLDKEQFYINDYLYTQNLYNTCLIAGSRLGTKQSSEAKHKMSLAKIGKISPLKGKPSYKKGIPQTERQKEKRILTRSKGIPRSEETKKKISLSKQDISKETREKMSNARRVNHKIENEKELKYCAKCRLWLDLSHFSFRVRSWDGVQVWCRDCMPKYQRKT